MTAVLSKLTVPVQVLKELVTNASKCATNDSDAPLTSLMNIKVKDNKLSVKTTDNKDYMTMYADIESEDFEVMVEAKKTTELISKLTSQTVSLTSDGSVVTVLTNNSEHYLQAVSDVGGEALSFNEPEVVATGSTCHISLNELRSILLLNKACKGDKSVVPACAFNYYADSERVITTNMFKACSNPVALADRPTLIPAFIMELALPIADESGIDFYQNDTHIVFESTRGRVVGVKLDSAELDEFPAAPLVDLISSPLATSVQVNRSDFSKALERMCLFVNPFENNKLQLTFGSDTLKLYDTKTKSTERLSYIATQTPITEDISLAVDGQFLKNQILACDKETLLVRVDATVGIQIKCGDTTFMLSVLAENE